MQILANVHRAVHQKLVFNIYMIENIVSIFIANKLNEYSRFGLADPCFTKTVRKHVAVSLLQYLTERTTPFPIIIYYMFI